MQSADKQGKWAVPLVCLLLVVAVFSVYQPVTRFDFSNYDDPDYVTKNYTVQHGISWTGIKWAFVGAHASNWHPLTWISHMLDFQLYGMWAGGHHLTSVIIHVTNTVLLFLVLRLLATWNVAGQSAAASSLIKAGAVAFLFGVHPMHVESVAWISERKDVLSGFFFMLTLLAYARYARAEKLEARNPKFERNRNPRNKEAREPQQSVTYQPISVCSYQLGWFILTLAAFACGLMSKPMLVTVPAVLIILDFWPLGRFAQREREADTPAVNESQSAVAAALCRRTPYLLAEKIPFALMSLAVCFITIWAQKDAIAPAQQSSLWFRLCNALVGCVLYIGKLFWPARLAPLYPEVFSWKPAVVIASLLCLCAIVSICAWQWKARPWLAAGFAWFFVMLLPVIGIVKVGVHLIADRYTYLPAIGVFMAAVWGAEAILPKILKRSMSVMAAIACASASCHQVYFWQNSFTLFRHTVAVTTDNYVSLANLGYDYFDHKELRQAGACLRKSIAINPDFGLAWEQLAAVLKDERRWQEAIEAAKRSLAISPKGYGPYGTLGQIEMELGRTNDAMRDYQIALQLKPDFADAHYNLANALARAGNIAAAREHYAKAAEFDPASPDAHNNYAYVLMRGGDNDSADREFRETLRLRPASWKAHYGLAQVLARKRNKDGAVAELEETVREKPDFEAAREMLKSLKR